LEPEDRRLLETRFRPKLLCLKREPKILFNFKGRPIPKKFLVSLFVPGKLSIVGDGVGLAITKKIA